jgi:transposase
MRPDTMIIYHRLDAFKGAGSLWRKSSGGTDSKAGSRFVERMLSVVATCRQQNRNVLELLTACCAARLAGSAAPSLLPAQAELAAA